MFTALSFSKSNTTISVMLSKDTFTKKLATHIKKLREDKGLSQEELAHLAKLYRTYVGHIENGRYSPSAYVLYKISRALNIDLEKLVKF
jgi:transcriptional regulator with XRE-family HTH domain